MQRLLILLIFGVLISCKNKTNTQEEFTMYQPSEMAALMNTMYHQNTVIRENILNGKDIGTFPSEYLAIHSAILTDPSDRTTSFEQLSKNYITNMKMVFEDSKNSQKERFNNAITSCIACHQTTCTGPIPKIKKLIIP